ncbi:MAG: zf-HC2 domain-containing protein [Burkholderiaceae bacterium]|nr:zf-HC2 domain-containing protein [Burkholderiaceae bacterium]
MNGLILRFAKPAHQTAQELLPWFATGALGARESEMVEQHLQQCTICQADLDSLKAVRTAYVGREVPLDVERLLDTIRPRIKAKAAAPSRPRKRGWLSYVPAGLTGWTGWALVAQLAVIVGLGLTLMNQPQRVDYRTLTSAGVTTGDLIVEFDPNTPVREVARILHKSGARVIEGPTVSNSYVLSIDRDRLPVQLAALRAEPAVVLAEALKAPAKP